ncbi:unnamed protein product [Rotaria sp. Silwood1]|nr:unnamed protein product [Rotaria sp. Silwood1]CAF1323112.1 unnamed protein product [Rotaria sp. Silwood1]CAF4613634.1 unnamed protein product [Rotaria sp. Silwood1]
MSALAKLPSESKRFHVYHCVNLDLSDEFKTVNTIVWWTFSLCTTSLNTLNNEQYFKEIQPKYPLIHPIEPSKNIVPHVILYAPVPIARTMVSKSQDKRLQTLLPVQCPLAALAKPVLQSIAPLNKPIQLHEISTKKKILLESIKFRNNLLQEVTKLSIKPAPQLTELLAAPTQKHVADQAKGT